MEAAAIGDKAVHEKTKSVGLAAGVVGVVVQEQHCGAGTMCHRLGRDGTFGMRCQRKRTHKDTLDHAGDLAQNTVAFAAGIRVGRKIHARAVKIRVGIQNFQKFLIGVVKRLVGGIIGRGSTADQTQKIGVVQLAVSRVRLQQAQKQAFGNGLRTVHKKAVLARVACAFLVEIAAQFANAHLQQKAVVFIREKLVEDVPDVTAAERIQHQISLFIEGTLVVALDVEENGQIIRAHMVQHLICQQEDGVGLAAAGLPQKERTGGEGVFRQVQGDILVMEVTREQIITRLRRRIARVQIAGRNVVQHGNAAGEYT